MKSINDVQFSSAYIKFHYVAGFIAIFLGMPFYAQALSHIDTNSTFCISMIIVAIMSFVRAIFLTEKQDRADYNQIFSQFEKRLHKLEQSTSLPSDSENA